ncbi:MAG TPA: GNAT family N-acetyltransferase [Clostridia bacterium]|nr:GNAT family N-acetyltransferase [Clostridia bacterium]
MNHKGTVTLETERLILRRFCVHDMEAMFRNWANHDVAIAKFLDWQSDGTFKTIHDWIGKYDALDCYNWAIVLKDLGEPIGYINAHDLDDLRRMLEVGYAIGSHWWHQRIVTEALKAIVKFFFEEVGINRIAAKHNATNPRSGGVMLNVGMRLEGIQRQASRTGCDVICYAILAEDYFASSEKQEKAPESNVATIKTLTEIMFHNLHIAMDTMDWNADICGAQAWRYIYHTIHSADRFFINPSKRFDEPEPPFHTPKLDWPDTPTDVVLSRETLYGYYDQVRQKVLDYIGTLHDTQLHERPEGCTNTRLGLIMEQFRHMYAHIGILNGITIARENRYPLVINSSTWRSGNLPEGLYDVEER